MDQWLVPHNATYFREHSRLTENIRSREHGEHEGPSRHIKNLENPAENMQ